MHLFVGRDFVPTISFTLGHFFVSVLLSIRFRSLSLSDRLRSVFTLVLISLHPTLGSTMALSFGMPSEMSRRLKRCFLVQPFDLKSYGDCYSCRIFRSTLLLPFVHSFRDAVFAFASCTFFRQRCFCFRLLRILSAGDAVFAFASCVFFRRRCFRFRLLRILSAPPLLLSPLAHSFGGRRCFPAGDAVFAFASSAFFRRRCVCFRLSRLLSATLLCAFFQQRGFRFCLLRFLSYGLLAIAPSENFMMFNLLSLSFSGDD